MDESFEYLMKYTFKSNFNYSSDKHKELNQIANLLMNYAHDKGWAYDVTRILDELDTIDKQ